MAAMISDTFFTTVLFPCACRFAIHLEEESVSLAHPKTLLKNANENDLFIPMKFIMISFFSD